MADEPDPGRLRALEEKLERARAARAPKPRADKDFSSADMAWRMVIEMVSGLGIGFGIGYGLDVLFGTMPLLLVTFTLLGLAAGVRVMLRTAAEMGRKQAAAAAEEEGS